MLFLFVKKRLFVRFKGNNADLTLYVFLPENGVAALVLAEYRRLLYYFKICVSAVIPEIPSETPASD